MFTNMEKWTEIRRLIEVEKRSKRSVCREFKIHWDTLTRILEHSEPPGYRQSKPRRKRKIEPYLAVIDEILRPTLDFLFVDGWATEYTYRRRATEGNAPRADRALEPKLAAAPLAASCRQCPVPSA